jgi:DnaK suppressor protein
MAVRKKTAKKKATSRSRKKAAKKPAAKTRKKSAAGAGGARKKKAAKRKTAKKKTAKTAAKTRKKAKKKAKASAKPKKKRTTRKAAAPGSKTRPARKRVRGARVLDVQEATAFTPYVEKRGESFMNKAQVAHFRSILLDWKRLLMEEVDRTVHHMQDEASNFPDPNDRATQEEEFALELRTRDRERKLIKKIDDALLRLDTGDYGYCEICGVEIGVKRLEARPTATLCIDCKTLDEIKEKQLG